MVSKVLLPQTAPCPLFSTNFKIRCELKEGEGGGGVKGKLGGKQAV